MVARPSPNEPLRSAGRGGSLCGWCQVWVLAWAAATMAAHAFSKSDFVARSAFDPVVEFFAGPGSNAAAHSAGREAFVSYPVFQCGLAGYELARADYVFAAIEAGGSKIIC